MDVFIGTYTGKSAFMDVDLGKNNTNTMPMWVSSEKESCLRHYLRVTNSLFIGLFSGTNVMDQYHFFVP